MFFFFSPSFGCIFIWANVAIYVNPYCFTIEIVIEKKKTLCTQSCLLLDSEASVELGEAEISDDPEWELANSFQSNPSPSLVPRPRPLRKLSDLGACVVGVVWGRDYPSLFAVGGEKGLGTGLMHGGQRAREHEDRSNRREKAYQERQNGRGRSDRNIG